MAVSRDYDKINIILNNSATQFAITFDVNKDDYGNAINIEVYLGIDRLIQNEDFTISGKTITYPDAVNHQGEKLTIFRATPIEQPVDFVDNGNFTLEDIEAMGDRAIMILQEQGVNLADTINAQESALRAEQYKDTAIEKASDAEDWAKGTRSDGQTPQHTSDSAKHYAESADTSASMATSMRNQSAANALVAEGYAKGTQGGEAVDNTSPYYQANSKYYKEQAALSAGAAAGSATSAYNSQLAAKDSEDKAKTSEDNAGISETNASTSATNAGLSATAAAASEAKAEDWAEKAEDTQVEPGKYSAKHYSLKASASATSAGNSATSAGTSESNAAASEAKADKWANEAEDTPVESGKYSAKHYSIKAASSASSASTSASTAGTYKDKAEKWAEEAEDIPVEAGRYSAKHYSIKAGSSASAASTSESNASSSASSASASRDKAAKWAEENEDTPVESGKYSAKHYSLKAAASATSAATSASASEDSAEDSEAYAVGKRNGSDVPSTDPTYHNNSKYYSDLAAQRTSGALRYQGSWTITGATDYSGLGTPRIKGDMFFCQGTSATIDGVTYTQGDIIILNQDVASGATITTAMIDKMDNTESVTPDNTVELKNKTIAYSNNTLTGVQPTLTTAQAAAANSGITSTKVGNYDTHIASTSNPHSVTKSQVGLGNCDNTSDANKPISTATQTALNGKHPTIDSSHKLSADLVDDTSTTHKFVSSSEKSTWNGKVTANTAITGATKCKITYDAKGLVTAGADLQASDIPNLTTGKVTALTGYTKASSAAEIADTDSLNTALGKIQKTLDGKQASGSYVTTSRKINDKALSADITLTASDVGAISSHQTIKNQNITGATINSYVACSTAAATAAKVGNITNGTFALGNGSRVFVKFDNANTADSPTLNINSKGAKNIFSNGAQITTGANKDLLKGICEFVYDGTQWHLVGNYRDTNTTYTAGTGLSLSGTTFSAKAMVGSGSSAAAGMVPAPPSTAGTTKFLREDGTWNIPSSSEATETSSGTLAFQLGGTLTYEVTKKGNVCMLKIDLTGMSAMSAREAVASNDSLPAKFRPVYYVSNFCLIVGTSSVFYYWFTVLADGTIQIQNATNSSMGGTTWTYNTTFTYLV